MDNKIKIQILKANTDKTFTGVEEIVNYAPMGFTEVELNDPQTQLALSIAIKILDYYKIKFFMEISDYESLVTKPEVTHIL